MGKKTLTNAHCLLELAELATVPTLKAFSGLQECQALARGFDWSRDEDQLSVALVEHIKHLRKDQRDPAEREALRVLRLAAPRGAQILATVAEQLHDNELIATFQAQDGGEIGRSVWMRTHCDESARLFDVAESILNTGDIRGSKRLYDAFDIPCDEAPPFIWNDTVRKELETQLTQAMRLSEPCEVVYVPLADEKRNGDTSTIHYLVARERQQQELEQPSPLLRALGLAHHWQRLLDDGRFGSLTEIAAAEEMNLSQASRIAKLAYLDPKIIHASLRAGSKMALEHFIRGGALPTEWAAQRATPHAWPLTKTSSPSAGGCPSRPCAAGGRNRSARSFASSAPASGTRSLPSSSTSAK